jgi:hypothetical protein
MTHPKLDVYTSKMLALHFAPCAAARCDESRRGGQRKSTRRVAFYARAWRKWKRCSGAWSLATRKRGDIMAMMNVTLRADVVTINPANDADI